MDKKETVQDAAAADFLLPEDIRKLLQESAAADLNCDEITKEYEEVFEETQLIMQEAESKDRTQEIGTCVNPFFDL